MARLMPTAAEAIAMGLVTPWRTDYPSEKEFFAGLTPAQVFEARQFVSHHQCPQGHLISTYHGSYIAEDQS